MSTKHFKDSEFACKCGCGLASPDPELLQVLELIRAGIGNHPIFVNSGCRCESHNSNVGGSQNSQHLHCKAADIWSNHATPDEISFIANQVIGLRGGIGVYETFCHIDVRETMSRWSG